MVKGETITQIAQKYNCTPSEIYNLNPDAQNGIQLDALLVIPIGKTTVSSNNTHIVAAKEAKIKLSVDHKNELYQLLNCICRLSISPLRLQCLRRLQLRLNTCLPLGLRCRE